MKSNNFFQYLRERHKLSLRNIRSGQEIWHIFTSRMSFILSFLALLVVIFIVILTTVAYTSILDFIPGYPGNKSRKLIVDNIARLDSLELQVHQWEQYSRTLELILDGYAIESVAADSIKSRTIGKIGVRSKGDSMLRFQIETDSNYMLAAQDRKRAEVTFNMVAPIRGAVVKRFNPTADMFGVEVTSQPNQSVMAVLDGAVILSSWDPKDGYMIVVEHAANMVSIYKKIARPLCKTGERVKSGQAIAMTGNVVEGKVPQVVFELWNNGNPVDPENYITF